MAELELEGGNIVEHMRKYAKMKHDLQSHFHMHSKVFRAINKHICDKCCLIEHPKDYRLKYWRGSGPVRFVGAWTYGTQYTQDKDTHRTTTYEVDYYTLEFAVSYTHKEDYDDEYGPNSKGFKFSLKVPIELELKFTQKAFDAWAKKVGEENKKKRQVEALKQLEELHKEFPEVVRQLAALDELSKQAQELDMGY